MNAMVCVTKWENASGKSNDLERKFHHDDLCERSRRLLVARRWGWQRNFKGFNAHRFSRKHFYNGVLCILNITTTTVLLNYYTTITIINYYPSDSPFTCDLAAAMPAEVFFVHVGIIIYRTGYSVIMPSLVHTKVCKRDKHGSEEAR